MVLIACHRPVKITKPKKAQGLCQFKYSLVFKKVLVVKNLYGSFYFFVGLIHIFFFISILRPPIFLTVRVDYSTNEKIKINTQQWFTMYMYLFYCIIKLIVGMRYLWDIICVVLIHVNSLIGANIRTIV